MIRTTVEALGGAQAVPSELIPAARELHQHLINQVTTSGGSRFTDRGDHELIIALA